MSWSAQVCSWPAISSLRVALRRNTQQEERRGEISNDPILTAKVQRIKKNLRGRIETDAMLNRGHGWLLKDL